MKIAVNKALRIINEMVGDLDGEERRQMKIVIDIDESELKELVTEKIAREILYEKNTKQKLIDASVKMAAAELCRKGLPELWRTDK